VNESGHLTIQGDEYLLLCQMFAARLVAAFACESAGKFVGLYWIAVRDGLDEIVVQNREFPEMIQLVFYNFQKSTYAVRDQPSPGPRISLW